MTNEEIISSLRGLIGKYKLSDEDWQTVEQAIKILSNSDEDCISRAEAIKAIRNYNVTIEVSRAIGKSQLVDIVDSINKVQEKMILELPSIQPKTDVLDKIRAEIEQTTSRYTISRERGAMGQVEWSDRLIKESEVLEIIDKYKAERSEDMSEVGVEIIKTEETEESGIKYLNINVSNSEVERNPDIVRLCADAGIIEYVKPKTGHWILADEQNKEDVENDNYRFICSECQCSDIHAKGYKSTLLLELRSKDGK